jgi:hypothetical protein
MEPAGAYASHGHVPSTSATMYPPMAPAPCTPVTKSGKVGPSRCGGLLDSRFQDWGLPLHSHLAGGPPNIPGSSSGGICRTPELS